MNSNLFPLLLGSIFIATASFASEVLTLSKAFDLALENEPKLKLTRLQAESSKEWYEQSKARLFPQVQGNLSWGFYGYDAEYLTEKVNEDYTSYSLSASQALFRPELWSALEENKARSQKSLYQYKAQEQVLGVDIVKAYFDYLRTIQNLAVNQAQKEFYSKKYAQFEELLKIGMTTKMDLLEAKVHRDNSKSLWISEQKRLNVAKLKLEHLINQPIDGVQQINFETLSLNQFHVERSNYETKLNQNPALLGSKAGERSAQAALEGREYEHYPKVDLSLSHKQTDTTDRVAHTYDTQAVIQLNIPIYRGGYDQSRIREQLKLREAAAYEVDYVIKENKLKFEAIMADRNTLIEKVDILRESKQSAELYVEAMEQGYQKGLKSIVDVLEAQAKLHQVQLDMIDSGFELINNHVTLLDLTGELNQENVRVLEEMITH